MLTTCRSAFAMLMLTTAVHASDLGDCTELAAPHAAIEACSQLVRSDRITDRQLAAVFNNRGNAYAATRELEEAIADYSMALALEPAYARAYYNRGSTYLQQRRYDLAIADLDQLSDWTPVWRRPTSTGGWQDSRAAGSARPSRISRWQSRQSPLAASYNNRGVAFGRKGEIARALADFGTAIDLDPIYCAALNNRGELLKALGRTEEADVDFRTALTLDPFFERARRNLLLMPDSK